MLLIFIFKFSIRYILYLYLLFYYGTYYSNSTIDLMHNGSKFWNKISVFMVPILSQSLSSNPRLKNINDSTKNLKTYRVIAH